MITLLTGANEFLISAERQKVVDTFLASNDAFGLERLDADELDIPRLRDALLQLPFLASKKLVVIKNVFSNKLVQEALGNLLNQMPEEIDVLLIDPKSDRRTKLYKQLAQAKQVHECVNLRPQELAAWAVNYAKEHQGIISQSDAHYLIDRIGQEQMQLARELEKLSVFGAITKELIDTHTEQALRGTVFDLLDKTFSGKVDDCLKLYDELLVSKADPSEILGLIGWQLHVFSLIKYAGPGALADVAKLIGVHPFVVGKALNVVRSMSLDNVKLAVAKALGADIMIKTKPADSADVVRVLLLELASI